MALPEIAVLAALSLMTKVPDRTPNLIIVISVDMLSGEIMDRYTDHLPGGLGRILREGAVFENAYQEHAFTETCPGHSTLLSGRHPSSTGIGTNSWIDSITGKPIYCVQDDHVSTIGVPPGTPGSSDVQFRGTTFGTWLKDQIPGSRVFAVAGKDRSAIMMAGPKTDGVYWFQEGFGFTTSTAYAPAIPPWLVAV
ncbi:MAG TPA: alkaline phosphatase family protein, partial [Vicinamibacterales bacterium]|nr:alkaline phosphatase family protein [Vicinamibacterales bacterium]